MWQVKVFGILILSILLFISRSNQVNLGHTNNSANFADINGRIVGGREVAAHSIPYQVAIINEWGKLCGGSLISREFVLTAAHCTFGSTSVTIILGAHNLKQNESSQIIVTSSNIINHESYHTRPYKFDIALVKLNTPVTLSSNVAIVNLAPDSSATYVGFTGLLTGWGKTTPSDPETSPVLRGIEVSVMEYQACARIFINKLLVSNMCTLGSGNVGGCEGDGGGPLVINNMLVGVMATPAPTCNIGFPTVYVRVSSYRPWIFQHSGL